MPGRPAAPPFASFWMGGFEGADHINGRGDALDMVRATGHADRLDQDYRRARLLGLRVVRESIGWRLTEDAQGHFDFSRAIAMAEAARRQGLQILWTLMHYGVPPGLTLLDDALVPRFARFAAEAARVLTPLCPGPRFYTPVNEISFLSWAASASDAMGPAGVPASERQPDLEKDSRVSGFQIKRRLVRAALAGIRAIRAVDPEARFLHVEPVVHVAPKGGQIGQAGQAGQAGQEDQGDPLDSSDWQAQADRISAFQWQAFDLLAGRMEPELGGHADALDVLGLNHYHSSQWETPGEKRLAWHLRDPRRMPMADLLEGVWRRYRRPLIVAETGHIGIGRGAWLQEVAGEAQRAHARGVPLNGVCLYPLLDRPDWADDQVWHRSGLWHVTPALRRRLNKPYARALMNWRPLSADSPVALPSPDGADTPKPGLLLMLPQPWEHFPARHQAAALALADDFVLRLVEPPRDSVLPPVLRRHTLAPHAELLVPHRPRSEGAQGLGGGKRDGLEARDGWACVPDEDTLALLRKDREQLGPRRWWCWPWSAAAGAVDAAWVTALAGDGWIHHPCQLGDPPPVTLQALLRLEVPADWPAPLVAWRGLVPDGYEAEETRRWGAGLRDASGLTRPTLWLQAKPGAESIDVEQVHAIRVLARQHPGWQVLVDSRGPMVAGAADAAIETDPPNLRWIGRLPPPLEAPMAAAVQAAVPFEVWAPLAVTPRALSALCGEAMAPVDPSQLRADAQRVLAAHQAQGALIRQRLRQLLV
ncbi:hypothetical protein [Roseateles depolymerans]|uniref:Amine oxidase n=1 Tax=Roseateles depolymerans TaxID=76731 RepID=A0A0U3MX69_9BURK|nr:hypothetical protein [Roseateles depolymerans]ALV06516.1 amine oxidase [Roseateles depolymerans]REG19490.1 hypothetical protein DES44_1986 [Roseateles depolymerans]